MDLLKAFSQRSNQAKAAKRTTEVFEQYEQGLPGHQRAIDLLAGWNCCFPAEYNLTAGRLPLFADPRILWLIDRMGSIENKSVLEIGPMEGMHTYLLNKARPARIDAVEANRVNFLRCLVANQILKIDRANFLLGDANAWLQAPGEKYDLIVASGVLYHMSDPVAFLRSAAERTDSLFLWTHFYSEGAMKPDDPRRLPFTGKITVSEVGGVTARCHERSYKNAARNSSFCGGMSDRHYWMERDDILAVLGVLGFGRIEIEGEEPDHPGGPCFSLLARRN